MRLGRQSTISCLPYIDRGSDLQTAGRLHVRHRDLRHGPLEVPHMALEVERPVGAGAIELVGRGLGDARAGGAGALAVRVDVPLDAKADELSSRSAEGFRTLHFGGTDEIGTGPLGACLLYTSPSPR